MSIKILPFFKNTAILYFQRLREIIAHQWEQESFEVFEGAIEVDESYFGGTQKGKRGRGAAGKVPVFGLLKRGGKVYTQVFGCKGNDTYADYPQKSRAR